MMMGQRYIKGVIGGIAFFAVIIMFSAISIAEESSATSPVIEVAPVVAAETTMPSQTQPLATDSGTANAVRKSADNTVLLSIAEAKGRLRDASVMPEALQTLFFTAWQHALLQEAKIGFNTNLPNPGEVGSSGSSAPRDPGIRELSLGGISYGTTEKWTVWLNGVRITPDAIPSQVLDIKVSRSHIDLKWFDGYTNKIYPVRMRPHERFNLDSRIFLPGTPAGTF
jgi:hypothetical protein